MMKRVGGRTAFAATAACAWIALAIACSATSSTSPDEASSGAASGAGGGGGPELFGDSGLTDALDPDAACAKVTKQASSVPVDLYLLVDRSSSMSGDKWDGAKAGLGAFVSDPKSSGIEAALKLFPRTPDATPACDQPAYAKPDVAYGPLPANAAAIVAAMGSASPNGFDTPVYPALGGAILAGIAQIKQHPDHRAAVLLVTDGAPQGPGSSCAGKDPNDPQVIAALAAVGAAQKPPVLTYVIGLPGVSQSFANLVAASGGTDSAIVIGAGDVEQQFEDALAKVRGEALPCEYELPSEVGGAYDVNQVNVLYTPGDPNQAAALLAQDPDCKGPGWRYDDPAKPTKILLCAASCTTVKADATGKVDVLLGCATEVAK